ncbi:MAG TPA: hypothetical protein VLM89_02205 [Phycisphaerae bacterium]|nr:hypothetical protein [Phycisphaerae bacterium]
MNTATTVAVMPVGFFDKLRVLAAAGVAVVLIGHVGWMAVLPADPDLAITFTTSGRSLLAMWPTLLVLTMVSAAVGSAIAGPRLPEAGLLAAGVGLVGLAIRGGSMQTLLIYIADSTTADRRYLMVLMVVDTVLWAALLGVAWLVVLAVGRWLWNSQTEQPVASAGKPAPGKSKSLTDLLGGGSLALAVVAIVALLVIWMTVARTPVANIARGQVIASVFFGLYLGAMAARYFTGVEQVRYYLAAPPVVAVAGYLLGYLQANMGWAKGAWAAYAALATTPPHALARPLPIEYIAVGLVGVIVGYWSGRKIEHAVVQE